MQNFRGKIWSTIAYSDTMVNIGSEGIWLWFDSVRLTINHLSGAVYLKLNIWSFND